MPSVKHNIKCSFDSTHHFISKSIPCSYEVVEDYIPKLQGNEFAKQILDLNFIDVQDTQNKDLFPCLEGTIKLNNKILSNAVIYFYKPNIKQQNTRDYKTDRIYDGINAVKNWHWNNTFEMKSENILVEKTTSNSNGYYKAFITNGTYDIKVEYNGQSELLKNIEITDAIKDEYYYVINGLIEKAYNTSFKMVNSMAFNIRGLPKCEIMIIQDDKLIVYRKVIDEYTMFALVPGIYDVRLRTDNTQLCFIKNFEFKCDFVNELKNCLVQDNFVIIKDKPEEQEDVQEIQNDEAFFDKT